MVELRDISLSYPQAGKSGEKTEALRNINVRFKKGKISAIIGPSGCGKTSLIKIMAGLTAPGKGNVLFNGKQLSGVNGDISVIFQDCGLLPWKTVFSNAELPLLIKGARKIRSDKSAGKRKITALLEEFGLAGFSKVYPHRLSGGMKQRLAIVRALAADSSLILMDEPFSSLDAITREDAQNFLLSVRNKLDLTLIIITHSIEEAVYLSDFVYVMKGINPGSITEQVEITRKRLIQNTPEQKAINAVNTKTSAGRTNAGTTNLSFREEKAYPEHCRLLRRLLEKPEAGKSAASVLKGEVF